VHASVAAVNVRPRAPPNRPGDGATRPSARDHLVERLGSVHVYRSGRFFAAPIQLEHAFDFAGLDVPVISGARVEAATHSVIVDAEVKNLCEMGQKVVSITAAPTDEQDFWFRAFEFADSLFAVPHPVIVMNGPTRKAGVGVGIVRPDAVGANRLVPAPDQFLVDRGFAGTR
jgi:hypothetical protein